MAKLKFSDIEDVLKQLVLPFYEIERDISVPIKKRRLENDAEHSWSLAFMASALAPEIDPTLDAGKVCQFAVVHDMVEIFAGDTPTFRGDHATKLEREAKALKTIEAKFTHLPWISKTIAEYESKRSNEAKYVYAMDKFINMFIMYADNNRHNHEHKITKQFFDEIMVAHRKKAHTHQGVAKYYDELLAWFDENSHLFYPEKLGRQR